MLGGGEISGVAGSSKKSGQLYRELFVVLEKHGYRQKMISSLVPRAAVVENHGSAAEPDGRVEIRQMQCCGTATALIIVPYLANRFEPVRRC
jgi:hypothetical protein